MWSGATRTPPKLGRNRLIGSHKRAFDCYLNKWPWMTFNGRNVTLAEGGRHKNFNEDRFTLSAAKCRLMIVVSRNTKYTVSQKTHKLWNGIAQNYNGRFWWHLAEIFKILWNKVCMFQLSCRFAFYQLLSFKPDAENNANFDAVSSKRANFDEVQFF